MFTRRTLTAASLRMMLSACSGAAAPEPGGQDSEPIANGPTSAGADGTAVGVAPAAAGGAVLDLGDVAAGARISFAVPAGTVGFKGERRGEVIMLLDEAAQAHQRKLARDYLSNPRLPKFQEGRIWREGAV